LDVEKRAENIEIGAVRKNAFVKEIAKSGSGEWKMRKFSEDVARDEGLICREEEGIGGQEKAAAALVH
jgi:hypothetical protein